MVASASGTEVKAFMDKTPPENAGLPMQRLQWKNTPDLLFNQP